MVDTIRRVSVGDHATTRQLGASTWWEAGRLVQMVVVPIGATAVAPFGKLIVVKRARHAGVRDQ